MTATADRSIDNHRGAAPHQADNGITIILCALAGRSPSSYFRPSNRVLCSRILAGQARISERTHIYRVRP
jgi:hypothetical protein